MIEKKTPDTDTPNITYSPSPGTEEDNIIIKTMFIEPSNYVEQNGYLKIFIGWLWGEGAFLLLRLTETKVTFPDSVSDGNSFLLGSFF